MQRRKMSPEEVSLTFVLSKSAAKSFLFVQNITSLINIWTAEQLKLKSAKLQFYLPSQNCYSAQFNTNKIDTAFLWGHNWDSVPSNYPFTCNTDSQNIKTTAKCNFLWTAAYERRREFDYERQRDEVSVPILKWAIKRHHLRREIE